MKQRQRQWKRRLAGGQWVGALPAIIETDVKRLPRSPSYSAPEEATVLIAIHVVHTGTVCVRNCWQTPSQATSTYPERGIFVENIGALVRPTNWMKGYRPTTTTRSLLQTLSYARRTLKARKFMVLRTPPFRISEPRPNFMVDLVEKDYDAAFAAACGTPLRTDRQREGRHGHYKGGAGVSPFIDQLKFYRSRLGVFTDWTPERIKQLAALWGMTVEELSAWVGCPTGLLENFLQGASVVTLLPESVLLWFHYMEGFIMHAKFDQTPVSIFPEELLNDRLSRP